MAELERLHRSELAVPGSDLRMLETAPAAGADVVVLDLEDTVAPDAKEQARRNVITALQESDWSAGSVSVRINGLDTRWCYRDIIDVVEQAGEWVDTILIPKVGTPSDVEFVATLLSQVEQVRGIMPINIHVLIETALGMSNVEEIAKACPDRLEAMVFGVGGFAASTRAMTMSIGGANRDYSMLTDVGDAGVRRLHWGDQWHGALSRLVVACRARGLRPIDGPYGDHDDADGYRSAARRAAALGCEGKWAIHPSQVALANEVFTPPAAAVEVARRIIAAMEEAAATGTGAVSLDGRRIDAASITMAENLLARVDQIEWATRLAEPLVTEVDPNAVAGEDADDDEAADEDTPDPV
jgi:malyl-CoA/(S)-citramalyl-CoA lyase